MSGEGPRVTFAVEGPVARIGFDNPGAHNALTSQMWLDLAEAARRIAADRSIRVAVLRGVGGKAFVSGTDISGFAAFESGADGIAYERRGDACLAALDAVPVTTVAVIEGWAIGGGLNIACACDFRIATPDARFGSPIGRTLGNCLSSASLSRIGAAVGLPAARRMVLLGEIVGAQEMLGNGFLHAVAERDGLEAEERRICERAIENAPLTTWATKEALLRLRNAALPEDGDIVERVYGSADFRRGVADFLARTRKVPDWTGE